MDHPSQSLAACVTTSIDCLKLWDAVLEHGPSGTLASYFIVKLLSKTVFSDRKCSVEQCSAIIPPDCALSNISTQHTDLSTDHPLYTRQAHLLQKDTFLNHKTHLILTEGTKLHAGLNCSSGLWLVDVYMIF